MTGRIADQAGRGQGVTAVKTGVQIRPVVRLRTEHHERVSARTARAGDSQRGETDAGILGGVSLELEDTIGIIHALSECY